MNITHTHCAGLDVHKKTVVACCITPAPQQETRIETHTFGTMTADLLALSDWLTGQGVTHVAMESTGELWKPLYNILEGNFELLVVNAKHIKNVPGRKTDVKDAEWVADLLRHGLLRGSFIPPLPQRDLRDLTRQRTNLVQDRATVVNRLHKVLEWANIKLTSVATDVTDVSARAMLEAILQGKVEPQALAELSRGRLRHKIPELAQALTGHIRAHHRFLIATHLAQMDFLDEQISLFDAQIAEQLQPERPPTAHLTKPRARDVGSGKEGSAQDPAALDWATAVALLDTIPGVGRRTAELLVAEIGSDMSRFPTAAHLASWAKLAPGNNESAGKRFSGRTGQGNRWLRSALVQAAHAAVRVKRSYLHSLYQRLAGRRGVKRAIVAVAHRILIAAYHMLLRHEPFRDLGATYLDERHKTRVVHRMTQRLEQLGFRVTVEAGALAPT